MPRPCRNRLVNNAPHAVYFKPAGRPMMDLEEVHLEVEGLEAIRLADLEGLDMESAAARMGVSRHTFGRILRKARGQVALALVQGMALRVEGGSYELRNPKNSIDQGAEMSQEILVAVPSDAPGGLSAKPSAHFGHCDAYTVARIVDKAVVEVDVHYNEGHEHGACVEPVRQLAAKGVKTLIAGGMGPRPLSVMQDMGMDVYFSNNLPTVGDVLTSYAAGGLEPFGQSRLCKGGCGH